MEIHDNEMSYAAKKEPTKKFITLGLMKDGRCKINELISFYFKRIKKKEEIKSKVRIRKEKNKEQNNKIFK